MSPAELDMLRHTWFPLARIQDVDQRGVVGANILGEALVVYRTGGVSTVAGGYCPHRGMALWLGRLEDQQLECPYHGWRFAADSGACTHVPSLPDHPSPPRSGLRVYASTEAYGHVWGALASPTMPMPLLPHSAEAGWEFAYGEPTDLGCGIRQVTENFRDMSHFAFVHRVSMGPQVQRVVEPYRVERTDSVLRWTVQTDLGSTALDGNSALAGKQVFSFEVFLPMFVSVEATFRTGGRSLVFQFATPTSADGLQVRHFWGIGIDRAVTECHGVDLDQMLAWEREIFEEDFPIMANMHPREAPLDSHSQAHTRADKFGLEYRRAYTDLVATYSADAATA